MQDSAANLPVTEQGQCRLGREVSLLATTLQGGDDAEDVEETPEPEQRALYGEFTLAHDDIVLTDVSRQAPDVVITPERGAPGSQPRVLVFSARGPDLDGFDDLLESSDQILDVLTLQRGEQARSYRIVVADEALIVTTLLIHAGARVLDVTGSDGSWGLRAQFRSQAAFSTFRSYCRDEDIEFDLRRLDWDIDSDAALEAWLTPVQREALLLAYRSGYFDVPRGITQRELAEDLDISPSAVSQRLRRATSHLIEKTFRSDDR